MSVALAAAALLGLGGCDEFKANVYEPYRYRLTAEVETPQGVRTGSSVIEVQWGTSPEILGSQQSAGYSIRGEAVPVDLPNGETLFVLLTSKKTYDWAPYALEGTGILRDIKTAEGANPEKRLVPRNRVLLSEQIDNYPYFVRFRDPSRPETVEQVDPDNLAESFGDGIRLRSLTVQMTNAEVTTGIDDRLPWLKTLNRSLVKNDLSRPLGEPPPFGVMIDPGSFFRGTVR